MENITLGELIRNKRKEMNLSIKEAADKIDVSAMTYLRLERDQTAVIPLDNIIGITNELELDFFKVLNTLDKEIKSIELETALKTIGRFYFKGKLLDIAKLEEKIEELVTN